MLQETGWYLRAIYERFEMPRDCPHSQCSYFLADEVARCAGCGRSANPSSTTWLAANQQLIARFGAVIVALFSLVLLLFLLPVNSSVVAGVAMASVAVAAVGFGTAVRPSEPSTPPTATIEGNYRQACDESQYWLERWGELFELTGQDGPPEDAEQLLGREALAAAADAAADAASRRDAHASRLIENGFERLDHAIASQPAKPSPDELAQVEAAIAVIEHYLETLWIDEHVAHQARERLAHVPRAQQRGQLFQIASNVKLLDADPPAADAQVAASGEVDPDLNLDDERLRLRAERKLLRESPLSDADFSGDEL